MGVDLRGVLAHQKCEENVGLPGDSPRTRTGIHSSGSALSGVGNAHRGDHRAVRHPTKNSLKTSHREYEKCLDLRIGYVRATPTYSAQQKQSAVDHYLSRDRRAAAILSALSYPDRGTLAAWIEERCPDIGKCFVERAVCSVRKSLAMKRVIVVELHIREDSARVIAPKAGVSRPMLYNWKNQATRLGDSGIRETPEEVRT